MDTDSINGKSSPHERAEEFVSFLNEKISLPEDIPDEIRPELLKANIEEVFRTAEETLKKIEKQK